MNRQEYLKKFGKLVERAERECGKTEVNYAEPEILACQHTTDGLTYITPMYDFKGRPACIFSSKAYYHQDG